MKTILKIFIGLLFIVYINKIEAQKKPTAQLTNYEILENGKKIKLFYKIENAYKNEKYDISLKVTRTNGEEIPVNHLSGDVSNVKPDNKEKYVIWDLLADKVFLSEELNFEILVHYDYDYSYYKLGEVMLKSAIFPGLGINSMNHKKSPLLLGFFTYTFLTASAVSEYFCLQNYDNYLNSYSYRRLYYYDDAKLFRKGTYTGLGIAFVLWSYSMLHTYSVYNKNKTGSGQYSKNIGIYPRFDNQFNKQNFLVTLYWKF